MIFELVTSLPGVIAVASVVTVVLILAAMGFMK